MRRPKMLQKAMEYGLLCDSQDEACDGTSADTITKAVPQTSDALVDTREPRRVRRAKARAQREQDEEAKRAALAVRND